MVQLIVYLTSQYITDLLPSLARDSRTFQRRPSGYKYNLQFTTYLHFKLYYDCGRDESGVTALGEKLDKNLNYVEF